MLATMVFTAVLGASAMAAPAAGAFDLTGTWTGTLTCNGFDGTKESAKFGETMTVLQTGNTVIVNLHDDNLSYVGGTIEAAGNPTKGEALFIACGTSPDLTGFNEIVRAQVSVLANGKTTFKASSIFNDTPGFFASCTWTGKQTCAAFDGTKGSFKFDSTMRVLQSGTTLVVSVDDDFRYGGGTIDNAAMPGKGEALFIECGTRPALGDFGEIVRGQVTTAANGTLTFKATSIFQDDGAVFGTCKWTYKRTDATPSSVTPCP